MSGSEVCPYLEITEITAPDYRSSDASARVVLHVSYACMLPPASPRNSRRVCPRADGRYPSCPVRLAERLAREGRL